ncbi:MAG: pilus assembly protein CpaE [Actinomycetota bacterium]|nr:pilus assembly protein CpaE [Actinomycetota bacterium]
MLSVALALRLRAAGLAWTPTRGDRFVVRQPEMSGETFVLSDMTIEVHQFPTGPVIGFNGTTEWALDSVAQHDTVWLPAEEQLRELLGPAFVALERAGDAFRVTIQAADGQQRFESAQAAEAYGEALLHVLTRQPHTGPAD